MQNTMRRCLVGFLLAAAAVPGAAHASPGTQQASATYGYPYPNAPDCTEVGSDNGCVIDAWRFYQGQCTSWVAYRLNQRSGVPFSNSYAGRHWGNASNWGGAARAAGIAVNLTPAVGAVAWYASNHVGYVEEVRGDGSVVMSEMNRDTHNGFDAATVIRPGNRWPSGFIHIRDLSPVTDTGPAPGSPEGQLDTVTGLSPGQIGLTGWTLDPDAPTSPTAVHVYLDGPAGTGSFAGVATAAVQRDDVASARPGAGANHGYAFSLTGLPPGQRMVYVYAINAFGGGGNPLIGSRSVTIPSTPGGTPEGSLDEAFGTVRGSVRLRGWTLDPDASTLATDVHIYLDGHAGLGRFVGSTPADRNRPDIDAARPGAGPAHGFDTTIAGLEPGTTHTAYAYAINRAGAGDNPLLRTITFAVPGPSPLVAIDNLTAGPPGFLNLTGWTVDPDVPDRSTSVHVYVDDTFAAAVEGDLTRPDVQALYGNGTTANSGFSAAIPVTPGSHKVQVYSINAGGGGANNLIAEGTVTAPSAAAGSPFGSFDEAIPGSRDEAGAIRLRGWSVDPDAMTNPVDVHVYRGGPAGFGTFVTSARADADRPDVAAALPGAGSAHGFDVAVTGLPTGSRHAFWVYAINRSGGGDNPLLKTLSATMPPPPPPPPPPGPDPAPAPGPAPAPSPGPDPVLAPGPDPALPPSPLTTPLGSSTGTLPPTGAPASTSATATASTSLNGPTTTPKRVTRSTVTVSLRRRLPTRARILVAGAGVRVTSRRYLGGGRYRLTLTIAPSTRRGLRDISIRIGSKTQIQRRAVRI